jgi:hypothetical protein
MMNQTRPKNRPQTLRLVKVAGAIHRQTVAQVVEGTVEMVATVATVGTARKMTISAMDGALQLARRGTRRPRSKRKRNARRRKRKKRPSARSKRKRRPSARRKRKRRPLQRRCRRPRVQPPILAGQMATELHLPTMTVGVHLRPRRRRRRVKRGRYVVISVA